MSFGLFCAARPHIYFYLFGDVSVSVEIGLNSRTIIVIAESSSCLGLSLTLLRVPIGKFSLGFQFSKFSCY